LTDVDGVRLIDMLGTGMAGLLWTADPVQGGGSHYRFLDFTNGTKPYLLDQVDNHRGAVTRVRYAPTTDFYLADATKPETRWKTPLPFPVQVVAAVEVVDQVSRGKLSTRYRYHHGYWDGAEREFRGFGMVEQLDTESFDRFNSSGLPGTEARFDRVSRAQFSPPTLTKTWFHLGPTGDEFEVREETLFSNEYWPLDPPVLERPAATVQLLHSLPARHRSDALRCLRGQVLRTELFALDGSARQDRPFTVTEMQYGIREEDPPPPGDDDRLRIFFPHPVAERSTQWERGTDPMHRFSFTGAYDAYGLAAREISLAVPRARDFRTAAGAGEPYLGSQTLTRYAQRDDARRYLVDRVAATTSYEIVNDGSLPLFDLLEAVERGGVELPVTGQTLRGHRIITWVFSSWFV
jgi:hypothetical protein